MLVNGQWQEKWQPVQARDDVGRFVRQSSQFRNWVTIDGTPGPAGVGGFKAEPDRYHLYVALICPWASRTLMVRKLKQLDSLIPVSIVEPVLTEHGWRFGDYPGASFDRISDATYLHELYTRADPTYSGRATVPVLWDQQKRTIVNNESADIVRMLNSAFDHLTGNTLNLYPDEMTHDIEALNEQIYTTLNNGVYQAGFASSQQAYDEAYDNVFGMLDSLEARLADGRRFVLGENMTETDIRLFVTLVRFDLAYHGLFKCNRNLLAQMPQLCAYVHRIRTLPGIAETVSEEHIKSGYYSIRALNPSGIVPNGPVPLM
ncbi:MAG: glutathione S-transferase family protein [Granulosicoccus sp.]|nr:glutathione S-transferase family protein [Granulosicoccus sp.]